MTGPPPPKAETPPAPSAGTPPPPIPPPGYRLGYGPGYAPPTEASLRGLPEVRSRWSYWMGRRPGMLIVVGWFLIRGLFISVFAFALPFVPLPPGATLAIGRGPGLLLYGIVQVLVAVGILRGSRAAWGVAVLGLVLTVLIIEVYLAPVIGSIWHAFVFGPILVLAYLIVVGRDFD